MLVVWQIRLPRALAAAMVGAALGMSGAALQGLLRNPLAEPGILGVSATAALFATFVLFFGLAGTGPLVLPLAAVAGALAATVLVGIAALRARSAVTLILVGIGLSSFSAALMALLMNLAPNPFTLADMINWTLGTVANRSFADLAHAAPFFVLGVGVLLASRRGLAALTLGEEAAEGIGLDLRRQRLAVILGAGLATGAAVSLAGAIGFVGIVAPHLVRPLVGHDPARLLVPSALLGALVLVLADIGVRLLPTDAELRLGVVAALVGAPVFAWIAARGDCRDERAGGARPVVRGGRAAAGRGGELSPRARHADDADRAQRLGQVQLAAACPRPAAAKRGKRDDRRGRGAQPLPAARARKVAYLPQTRPLAWPVPVRDVIALGRFAHGVAPGRLAADDARAVARAIAACRLAGLEDRAADTLSGASWPASTSPARSRPRHPCWSRTSRSRRSIRSTSTRSRRFSPGPPARGTGC